jgi:anion-transporting  ArsA/GET3 family ATPase
MLRIAGSILGSDLLERVSEFLLDLRTTYDGVSQRGREIELVFRDAAIVVVTTADPFPVSEAVRFYRELPRLASTPTAVLFNRALPETWIDPKVPEGTTSELAHNAERWSAEALRQKEVREEFASRYGARVATLPWIADPPTDLKGLSDLVTGDDTVIPWEHIGIA